MRRVFISYAREDRDVVLGLYDELQDEGFALWLDEKNLLPGQEWESEIERAIRESDVFIACLSNNSVSKRGYVQAELRKALKVAEMLPEGEIFIIPVLLDDCTVPSRLSRWQWMDYREAEEKSKLFQAIRLQMDSSGSSVVGLRQLFDAGERLKAVREELGLGASEFIELAGIASQREYESMETREREVPISLLKKVSELAGVNIDWLKHAKGPRYSVAYLSLRDIDADLNFCASLEPQDYYLTLDKKSLHLGLVARTSKYIYLAIDFALSVDFWNWVEDHWAIPALYRFLNRLSEPWHDIRGVFLPTRQDTQLFEGDIHFLEAARHAQRFGGNLLYDLLDLDRKRLHARSYAKIYGGNWMDRVHGYFREVLRPEQPQANPVRHPDETDGRRVNDASSANLEVEFERALRGTYDAARAKGYVATYFLQMLEEYGGKETTKRLLAKSDPQSGLFQLWELGLLNESMEAIVIQEKYRPLFSEPELDEARRRLEELGYFREGN